jgi:hypothetical protein
MAVSDVIIGFHDSMVYTWGSVLAVSALGLWLKDHKNFKNVILASLSSCLLFFVVSNFGSFLSLYPHTWAGLQECYRLAIPFYRSMAVSTLAYSVMLYLAYEWLLKRNQSPALARWM